jgi:hypothetical protein
MRIAALSVVVVSLIFATASADAQETHDVRPLLVRKAFDIGVGKVRVLHSGKLSGVQIIKCRFSIDDFRTEPDIFASADPQDYGALSYMAQRLCGCHTPPIQFD